MVNIACNKGPQNTDLENIIKNFNNTHPEFIPIELDPSSEIQYNKKNESDNEWFVRCISRNEDEVIFLLRQRDNQWESIWNSDYYKQWGSQIYKSSLVDIDNDGMFEIDQRYNNLNRGRLTESISIIKFINNQSRFAYESIWGGNIGDCFGDLISGDTLLTEKEYEFIDTDNDDILELIENSKHTIFLSYSTPGDSCNYETNESDISKKYYHLNIQTNRYELPSTTNK